MIPRISRGSSHIAAGKYYLHDVDASTKERVDWTYTVNVPTDDPEQALRFMAFTAMNADQLKNSAGVSKAGRKAERTVYTYSLSWHPEEQPEKQEMIDAALETLAVLDLSEREAVLVAHNDTPHKHVHILTSLVHPENGRMADVSHDRLTLSRWAEQYEKEVSQKVYCEQRVENNRIRDQEAAQGRQLAMVKYKEKTHHRTDTIQALYEQSDSGQAFRAALEQEGLTLAKGDRRGFTIVDENGKVSSLTRNLKGVKLADVKARLAHVTDLPRAAEIAQERRMFDRDQYETDRQKQIVDSAIEHEQKKKSVQYQTPAELPKEPHSSLSSDFLKQLDEKRRAEQKAEQKRSLLAKEYESFYQRNTTISKLKEVERKLSEESYLRKKELLEQKQVLQQELEIIDWRISEQQNKLEQEMREEQQNAQDWELDEDFTDDFNQNDLWEKDTDWDEDYGLDI